MQVSRRKFLANTSIAIVGASLNTNYLFASSKQSTVLGIQLYSVRDDMRKDPLGTLQQLALMGYKNVEHANYINRKFYGFTPVAFKKILDDVGLKMPSGHTVMEKKHWDPSKKILQMSGS